MIAARISSPVAQPIVGKVARFMTSTLHWQTVTGNHQPSRGQGGQLDVSYKPPVRAAHKLQLHKSMQLPPGCIV